MAMLSLSKRHGRAEKVKTCGISKSPMELQLQQAAQVGKRVASRAYK